MFKPRGKTNLEVLSHVMDEAVRIVTNFQKVEKRHRSQIAQHRGDKSIYGVGKSNAQIKECILKNLFELAEPEGFDFDFHEVRRAFYENLDAGIAADFGEIFVRLCMVCGIGPLIKTIWSANLTENLLYTDTTDPRSPPELDLFMFDSLEIDKNILQIYIDTESSYGRDLFNSLIGGNVKFSD